MFLFLVIVFVCTCTGQTGAQTEIDLDDVRTIKNQLNLLMENRQRDYQQMEKSLRESIKGSTDFDALKEEIQLLRDENLRMSHSSNDGIRDKVAVGWLKEVIGSLRSEMQSVWSAINETTQIHKTIAIENDLQALRNDINSDRRDLQTLQGELISVRKNVEEISTKHSELEKKINTITKHQNLIEKKIKENYGQSAYNSIYKRVAFNNKDADINDILRTNVITTVVTDREAQELEYLESSRRSLTHRMARLEKHLKGILYRESTAVEQENRLSRLEADLNATKESLAFNSTRQDATQDRLHGSLLELLESVENLDDRVDACLPEVRKEISKIEFAVSRMNASMAIIKEDQNNQILTTRALGEGMSAMQRKIAKSDENKNGKTIVLTPHLTRENCTECAYDAFNELATLQNSFKKIVDGLPKDCSKIKSSGMYLITPDAKNPLYVHCDISDGMSWVTIQKRTNDRQKFNNNWNEYAKGFGDINGDYWLGNDVIHQLTTDNTSSLRIDMTDIYGNNWRAEYSRFAISDASDGYRLNLFGYQGNASDALSFQNGHRFSTADRDQDTSTANCAADYEGGWWYSKCQHANLNGKYNYGLTWFNISHNQWMAIKNSVIKVGHPLVKG